MVHADGPVGLDGVAVDFDDERAVADAGIVVCATLAQRLGIESLVDHSVVLGDRPGAANPGAKVMTLVSAMALGADCIDHCDVLRAGRTGRFCPLLLCQGGRFAESAKAVAHMLGHHARGKVVIGVYNHGTALS